MTRAERAFTGALAGALLALAANPGARSYIAGGMVLATGPMALKEGFLPAHSVDKLGTPRTLPEFGRWVRAGANKANKAGGLSVDQALLLAEICQAAERVEPGNAFWAQSESAFTALALQDPAVRQKASEQAWESASGLKVWNDHQTESLQLLTKDLAKQDGGPKAWHQAVAMFSRDDSPMWMFYSHGRKLLADSKNLTAAGRLATLKNGAAARNGARTVTSAWLGARLVELSSSGRLDASPRDRAKAHGEFYDQLREEMGPAVSKEAAEEVEENIAWMALVPFSRIDRIRVDSSNLAVLVATVPGALLLFSVCGACFWALGSLMALKRQSLAQTPIWIMYGLGAVTATFVFWQTLLVWPTIWAGTIVAALGTSPTRPRPWPVSIRGPFALVCALCGVVCGILVSLRLTYESRAWVTLRQVSDAGSALDWALNPVLGFGVLAFTGCFAACAAWAWSARIQPMALLPDALLWFGKWLFFANLGLAIIATPACIVLDKQLAESLGRMASHEPNSYLAK